MDVFASTRAVSLHAFSTHGWRHPAWAFEIGNECLACLGRYPTRLALFQHLAGPKGRCVADLQAGPITPLPIEDIAATVVSDAEHRAAGGAVPTGAGRVQAAGPLPEWAQGTAQGRRA